MATVSRSTKISGGTVLVSHSLARAADVETDMLAIFSAHNNHDSGTSKWTVVSVQNAVSTPLISDNAGGTNDLADFRNNGTSLFKVSSTGATTLAKTSAQIVLGTTNTTTISSTAPSAPRVITIPDAGADSQVVLNVGASTLGGVKTFNGGAGAITMSASTIAMGANKITGLAAPTAAGDAVRYENLFTVTAFTPAVVGCGTIANSNGFYQQIGTMVHVWGAFQCGTVTASNFSMTIPTGSIVYTNRMPTTGGVPSGLFYDMAGAAAIGANNKFGVWFVDGSDTANIYATQKVPASGTANFPKTAANTIFSNSDYCSFDFWYHAA